MQPRRLAGCLAVVLSATLLSPVVLRPTPAVAHTSCAASSETDYYPSPSPWSDGETVRIRMVSPVSGAGCSKPAAGWPLIIYLHGNSVDRCSDMSFAARSTIATWGFVVLSFTARGGPYSGILSSSPCDQTTNATDAFDDDGRDLWGSRDKKDVTQLINWARDNYTPSGCADQCVDDSLVGIVGFSYGGARTWAVGVPSPTNPDFDSRVKAIAPVAGWSIFDNIKNLSSDGAATPTVRPRATASSLLWWSNQGWFTHLDRPLVKHISALDRAAYRNLTPPSDSVSFWDARHLVDDDSAVDQAGDITIPTFVVVGWLDDNGAIYNQQHIEGYNKVNTTAKYMYLGSCAHSSSAGGDPCLTTNKNRMRDALHRFLDRHVRGDTTCGSACEVRPPGTATCSASGPCVIYTVPTKWVSGTNNPWYTDNWSETSRTSWPPSDATTETRYFRNAGTLTTTSESGTTCTPGTPPAKGTGCSTLKNNLTLPVSYDICLGSTYATDEVQSYDWSFTADKKMAKLEADLYLSSDTARQQVYVDLFLTNSSGTELTRVWRSTAQIAPVKRDGTANTVYRFKFVPGGSGWTVANGQKLRVKVASKYAKAFPGEPLPATYTLYHNDTYRSAITLTYVP